MYRSVHHILEMASGKKEPDPPTPAQVEAGGLEEIALPDPEPLSSQFSLRAAFLITDEDDDRLCATYWLSTPMGEESEHDLDMIRVSRKFNVSIHLGLFDS